MFAQTKNRGQLPGSSPRLTLYKNTAMMYKYASTHLSRCESIYFGRRIGDFREFFTLFACTGKRRPL
jgi:hypothetical protein